MVCYTNKEVIAALENKFRGVSLPEKYRINFWISKNEHIHLNISKLKQGEIGKDEFEVYYVYEELSNNDSFFNEGHNSNVHKIRHFFRVQNLLSYIMIIVVNCNS